MSFLKRMIKAPHGVLDIKLEKNDLTLGDTLTGVLLFSAMENFFSKMVRCEVECMELFRSVQPIQIDSMQQQIATQTRSLYSETQQLQGQKRYLKGRKISLPFSFIIPKDAPPSFRSDDVTDIWSVKGVVAVDGRPDITTQIHFEVSN